MLPFLKKKEGSMSGPVEVLSRDPDEGSEPFSPLKAIAKDMMDAFHSKNEKLLTEALEALGEHLQSIDQEQDETLMNKEG